MIKRFPQFQAHPIERETALKLPALEHSSEKKNKEEAKKQEEILARLRSACSSLKNSNPDAWATLEFLIAELYASCDAVGSSSPMDLIGAKIDSGYWPLVQAYTAGQKVILKSLFDNLGIKQCSTWNNSEEDKKSFFTFVVDRFLDFWSKP